MSYLEREAALGGAFMHPGGRDLTRHVLQVIEAEPRPRRVLDVGCGTGSSLALAAGLPATRAVGVELSPTMQAEARRRSRRRRGAPAAALIQADATALPFAPASFDVVYAESVVALVGARRVLFEMYRILKPGGLLLLNERIWKTGVTADEAAEVNVASLRAFGIPAAAPEPRAWADWLDLLGEVGFVDAAATPVDEHLRHRERSWHLARRLRRAVRYLARPQLLVASLQAKAHARARPDLWARLESYLFQARRAPQFEARPQGEGAVTGREAPA